MTPERVVRGAMIVIILALLFLAITARTRASTRGVASWYDDGEGFYAAVPSFTWGDRPYRVRVTDTDTGRSVIVIVRDHCGCLVGTPDERVIDLSPEAFAQLAPTSVGLIHVRVEQIAASDKANHVSITPPPTDTETPTPKGRRWMVPL